MAWAYVAVGSNLEPERNVREALGLLARATVLRALSTVYRTEAEGRPEQPAFYNCVVALETERSPLALKQHVLRAIEARLGRQRSADRFAPRPIDLDLILYDELLLETPELVLPDPLIARRPYLAYPLQELAPALRLPNGVAIAELCAQLSISGMEPLAAYTARLRDEYLG